MSPEHEKRNREKRFARIRRAKWLLRFVPRRARFHHYPLIGRFADIARKRDYLWSFRTESVRPAIYAGSILAMQPLLGVQAVLAFFTALVLRANVMVTVGLQFITTPLTFLFIYKGTFEIGQWALATTGLRSKAQSFQNDDAFLQQLSGLLQSVASPEAWTTIDWGGMIMALILGGLIAGAAVGAVLDLIWRFLSGRADARRIRKAQIRHSDSTPNPTPPK